MSKYDNLVIPKECEFKISIPWGYREEPDNRLEFTVYAKTRSKAIYQAYRHIIDNEYTEMEYSDFIKGGGISIRKIGKPVLKSLYSDDEFNFNATLKNRNINFVFLGMKIDLTGQGVGYIVGCNSSSNLDVYFPEKDATYNCHPYHELTYYDDNGEIVKCYKED